MLASPFLFGTFTSAGLLVAIGAQNAYVLKQGLMKHKVFLTALFCSLADALLITMGVGGLGSLITASTLLLWIAKWGGFAFLIWYGSKSFRACFRNQSMKIDTGILEKPGTKEVLLTLSAFTFLNPQVYLDTLVLVGTVGSQFESSERTLYAAGAILGSWVWFFSLAYGSRLLAPLFENPVAWRILDFLVGCVMWAIAFSLLF